MSEGRFYGKYRGVVTNINDPLMLGRVKVKVPDVLGADESGWATPCAPFGGREMGFFALPSTSAGVWVEFEYGDSDRPIWSGCWWGSSEEMPPALLAPPYVKVMLRTAAGHTITLDDTEGEGGITLETAGGQKVTMNETSVEITNGQGASIKMNGPEIVISGAMITIETDGGSKVALTGPQVSVNNGALEVI